MAEFKLGRIRFVWQGDWSANIAYVADDVVSFGGKSYICVKNHTASSEFNTDYTDVIPKWEIVSDGTSWKGLWEPEVEYAPGDVVKYGANVYICETGHVSATFVAPTYLGLEEDLANWTEFATSFDWKGDWVAATRYKLNDLVRYGGYVYVCNTAHVAAATTVLGLEADQSKWTLFSDGLVYTGEWVTTTRYRVNDLVKYGGNIWIANTAHTSSDFETDNGNWDQFVEGFQYEDSWNNISNYQIGDTVTYGGYVYVAKTNNTNSQPTTNPADWDVFTTGFSFQGDWSVLTSYKVGDVVRLGGSTYVALSDNTGNEPPEDIYWSRLNSGINWTYSTETFLQVLGANVSGSGSGARFDVVKSKTVYTVSVSTGFGGTGYALNNIITISGSSIGGTSPANDLTVTVTGVSGGAITAVTWTGYSSTWKSGTSYHVGDVVFYGASSFIAVTKHTAATGNRPDNDLTADYWNILTLGSEALSLTTEGDLVYYGANGPTRLPIGVDGQILRATDGFPAWANYGLIDNVVYVGPLGINEPAPSSGLTVDKPWASVRYALEQVRDGYLNPQARDILKNNKEFFMKEVTNWISYTYRVIITASTAGTQVFTCADTSRLDVGMPISFTGTLGGVTAGTIYYVDAITSSTTFRISVVQNSGIPLVLTTTSGSMQGNLAYDAVKCERDTGYIVDALIYDVSRGGTLKTINAAKSYYTVAGNLYINGTFGSQAAQTVAANEYLKSMVATVLSNQQPVNYQSLNGVLPEDRAVQIIDLSLEAEATGKAKAGSLIDIITTGISAGSATAIPTVTNPNTTVFIKTGTYNEILPIIVPEYTAIVGDELRTSVIQPAPAIPLLVNDKEKTTSALNRIKSVIPEVLQNVQITPSAGNTAVQQYINGYGGTTTATNRLNNGIELISDILANGLAVADAHGTAPGATPTGGANNAYTAGYADAVAQLTANKAFIQEEITAWIADQVLNETAPFTAAFTYDAAACERDVGYIIDSLVYDLTYGGNLETTVTARSYFAEGSPVYGVGEKDEVLAAYARLKTVVGEVILETTVTTSPNVGLTQDTDGTPGSVAAQTQAEALVQEIYDTIDADGTLATPVLPDTTWVPSTLLSVDAQIVSAKSAIQESVIDFINTNYGNFIYDSAKCRRDAGLLKTGAAYDIALGTNYNAVRDGLAYRRSMGAVVIEEQLTQTLGAIAEERDLVAALLSDANAISRNTAYWTEVLDIITNGTAAANALVYTDTGVTAKTLARTELQTNRASIISDLTAWIAANYPDHAYDVSVCERDTGRIVDAISYDIQYGGNTATVEAANAYFVGYAEVLPVVQRDISVAAFEQLSIIAQGYITNTTEKTEADTLIQVIVEVLNAGSLSTLPTKVYPDIAWVDDLIEADVVIVNADTTVVPAVLQFITDTYSGFVYNHAKCSRDIGYIIDGLRYDIMFNSDFRSLKSGMAYRRGLASTGVVLDSQLNATLGSIGEVRTQIKEITTGTNAVRANAEIIRDIMISGVEPTSFTITDPTDYDTGFFNARRLIVANKQFLIDEVEAYMIDNYNSIWTGLGAGGQAACLRDMGYIIDALRYDLTYRGNLETIVAARSYYSNGIFVEPSNEKTAALAVQARLADIIDNIAIGNTAGWTKSSSNGSTQDVTGTPGSAGAAAFASDRINEIYNTIDTGDVPALITPSTDWVDGALVDLKEVIDSRRSIIQAGAISYINLVHPTLVYNQELCSRDVGYIVDAIIYDTIFGSDFRSSKAGMSYLRGITSTGVVLANQLAPTIDTIEYIEAAITDITVGVVSATGTTIAANAAASKADVIKNVIQNGLNAVPAIVLPSPTGHNTTLVDVAYATTGNTTGATTTYGNAADQLAVNRAFIQLEVRKWLEDATNGYDTFWATISASGQDNCIRDVGYIVDAIRYDLTYGGNTQSLIAGSAYYSNFALTIGFDELPATLAAYARMRTVIAEVIAETTVTKSPGNTLIQDVNGTPGNAASIAFAEDRVDDVLDWISNAAPNATIEIATDWADTDTKAAYARLVAKRNEIIEDTVYWVEKFWQKIQYNQDTCRRDAGLMVDAVTRDTITGSNFASIKAGMSYYRLIASAAEVVNNELEATVGSINFLKQKVKHVAVTTASAHSEIIIDDITAYINGGKKPTLKVKATSTVDANDAAAAMTIWDNKAFIQADVIAFLAAEYPAIEFSQEKCLRDVGVLVDALRYDLVYGGTSAIKQAGLAYWVGATLQIDENDKQATIAAYEWVKFLASDLAVNQLGSPYAVQTEVVPTFRDANVQDIGDANSALRVVALMDYAIALIDQGESAVEAINITDITSNVITSEVAHGLGIGDELTVLSSFNNFSSDDIYHVISVPSDTTFTVSNVFGGTVFALSDGPLTESLIVWNRNPNISSVTAAIKQQNINLQGSKELIKTKVTEYIAENYPTLVYDEAKCSRDVGLIIDAVGYDMLVDSNYRTTTAALAYYRGAQADLVLGAQKTATVQSYRELKNLMASYISGSTTALKRSNTLMDIIINMLITGVNETPETSGTVYYNNDVEIAKGVDILKANKEFLANEATAWVTNNFGGTVISVSNADNSVQTSTPHNLLVNDPVVFGATIDELTPGITYYVKTVPATDKITVSTTVGGAEVVIVTGGTTTSTVTYAFDAVACRRDMVRYVEAIAHDLQYPGNHHATRAAILYLNAVNGSEKSDMFYVRNSTGVRNMTLSGLRGNLTELNEFGTRRPTAGAYVSLDPGFGPWDTEAWITNKSPYVQNVTTFGVGCVGNKIDGALHAGGNRSTVSNDFTQVLSDGIGVWCTGNNSLTELVSVFAYYNYSGYLADLGGRIRATNGNSSYGTYGTIAEGTDTGEVPLFCEVDNLSQDAYISEVVTDGDQEVLRFEFDNAGRNYTNAQHAISGSGFNAATVADEFRDAAIFETRLIDLDDGNGTGGADYLTAKNVAQGGNLISATIAATDTALLGAYNGMRIQVTAGTGVGQYGDILTYNNGLKVAKVYKDSFENLTVTNTTVTTNVLTVASTASLYVNMPIYLSADIGGLTAANDYYVTAITSGTQFTVSATQGGADVALTTDTGSVTLYAAGWDHIVPGTPIAAGLDLTSAYIIEPRIKFTDPGFVATATTTSGTEAIRAAAFAGNHFVALQNGGTATYASADGKTWTASGAIASANWTDIAFGGGTGATARVTIGGLGGSDAILEAELGELNSIGLPGPTQIKQINVIDGGKGYTSPPTITITPVSGGGGAAAVCTVLNGVIQEVIMVSTGAGYGAAPTITAETDKVTEIIVDTYGKGYKTAPTVTISGGGASEAATAIPVMENEGVYSITIDTPGAGYTSVPTVEILDPNAKFVAIAAGATTNANITLGNAISDNAWSAGTALPNSNFAGLTYGDGVYVAVGGTGGAGSAATSTDGSAWVSRTNIALTSGTFSAVAYGAATYVAINTGGNKVATSSNGIVWAESGTLPSTNTWASIAYGNGRFVAIATGSREVAVSYDKGATWVASPAGLPSADNWSKVKYGQGLFMAVAEGSSVCATSADGITWNEKALDSSAAWNGLVFGNPNNNPIWATFTNAANNVVNYVETGAKATARLSEADGGIISTRMIEPGSGYPKGTVVSTTSANTITLDSTARLLLNQPITFTNISDSGLENETPYYINTIPDGTTITVSLIAGSGTPIAIETALLTGATFKAGPIETITDPNATVVAPVHARQGDGALANPTFTNRGTGYQTATAESSGDGFADLFQASTFLAVRGLFDLPEPGSNVVFASIPNTWFKLVAVSNILGSQGNYNTTFQISPALTILQAPLDGTLITTTNKYSQVRLTGHDFLYIGTGNQADTNYPFVDITTADQDAQQLSSGGGRVFFTSTDQDGNFNVGGLFGVQQSTGTATLDADAFNLAGLQSLQLNGIGLGIGSAIITQFSTDPFFTANSDNIVPTQRAIKSYITAQIGGGQSSLNVNTLTAGVVFIANDEITTTNGGQLNIKAKMNFTGGIDGAPVALGFFLAR